MKKIPAILKFILLALITFRVFSNSTYTTSCEWLIWLRVTIYVAFAAAAFFSAKIPFKSLKKLSFIVIWGLCILVLALIPNSSQDLLNYRINEKLLLKNLLYVYRLFATTFSALVVFETTSNLEIFDAFEDIENVIAKIFPPIKKIRISQVIAVTIIFIPAIFNSWEKIKFSAKARISKEKKIRLKNSIINAISEFYALFLYMVQYAENTRKAIENRR